MKQNTKYQLSTMILMAILLFVAIGYSYLTTSLSINGTADIDSNRWNVHFENVMETAGSVMASTPATIDSNQTTITYSVRLSKPGDYYMFNVEVKNDGTLDAMLNSISSQLNGVEITTLPDYIEYQVTYTDGLEIEQNHELKSGESEFYRILIKYKDNINSEQLPTTPTSLSLSFSVEYIQEDNNGKEVRTYVYRSNSNEADIGDDISVLGTTYNSYQEVVDATGYEVFFRHAIANNKIVSSDIGYVKDGKVYYLLGYGSTPNPNIIDYFENDSIYYQRNIEVLYDSYGEENCTSHSSLDGTEWIRCELETGSFAGTDTKGLSGVIREVNWYCGFAQDMVGPASCYMLG